MLDRSLKGDHGIVLSPSALVELINSENLAEARIAFDNIAEATGAND